MARYYNIYMQKEKSGSPVKNIIDDFDMQCADIPFRLIPEVKPLTERNWAGEDGKDVYVPKKLSVSAYTMKIKLCCKGEKYSANDKIQKLLEYLTGSDGSGVYMKLYCDYTKIGRQDVRFTKMPDEAVLVRDDMNGDILVFTVEVSVDDPVTSIAPATDATGNITKLGLYGRKQRMGDKA